MFSHTETHMDPPALAVRTLTAMKKHFAVRQTQRIRQPLAETNTEMRKTGMELKEQISCRKAAAEDIPLLVKLRMDLLHDAIHEGVPEKWAAVESQIRAYYEESIPDETHIAYLAFDGQRCVGTGGVCFYRILPTYFKPTGKKAYIISMYTDPAYRRKGIGRHLLKLLVDEALSRGATYISLESTEAGKPLYRQCGFGRLTSEMQYMNETYEGPDSVECESIN